QKLLCSNCNNILPPALQTPPGHRYCSACLAWTPPNNKNAICQTPPEEDPPPLGEESLLAEERPPRNAAPPKEISELRVHCVTPPCSWPPLMKDFEACSKREHQSLCEYALIPCHTGCGHVVMRRKLADHLENGCVNNVTVCPPPQCSPPRSECQVFVGKYPPCLQSPPIIFLRIFFSQQSHSTSSAIKDGCCFSEHCLFQGSKEKPPQHENPPVGAHMLLLLQHIPPLQGAPPSKGFTPRPELGSPPAGKPPRDLQIPAGLEFSPPPEVDPPPGSSVPEEQSVLPPLMRAPPISELENKLHVFENIVAVLNKEVESSNLEILAPPRQSDPPQNIIRGLELKIAELHRCLTQKDAGLSSLHKSLLFSEQAPPDGISPPKITDVGRKLQDSPPGRTPPLYSPGKAQDGDVCLTPPLNGPPPGKGTHMSLFFVPPQGDYPPLLPWPFRHKVTFMLLDQNNSPPIIDAPPPDLASASFQRPAPPMNVPPRCPTFLPLSKLQSPRHAYVKEDTLFLKCIIETPPQ
ncbi:TRAF1 factor, partial [Chloropsis hardwickii]|nr:TRAF1 factor [Chloropsis hardwickii]